MNPQSLNRYSYVNNNPINYNDPSGHDPLDDQWHSEFEEFHGRSPGWMDRLIRLFSIAYPDEWEWSAFYDSNKYPVYNEVEDILTNAPASRSWATMSDALSRMSTYYAWNESGEFARDIGTLFAGLPDRFSASMNEAVTGCVSGLRCGAPAQLPAHVWAYLQPTGMPSNLRGDDGDSNVHHWAWGVTLGYSQGDLAVAINTAREVQQAGGVSNAWNDPNSRADVWLGNRGALFGSGLGTLGPRATRLLYSLYVPDW